MVAQARVNVPPFYFPHGKPITQLETKEFNDALDKAFGPAASKKMLASAEFGEVATEVFKIPKIFCEMLHKRIE